MQNFDENILSENVKRRRVLKSFILYQFVATNLVFYKVQYERIYDDDDDNDEHIKRGVVGCVLYIVIVSNSLW